MPNMNNIPTKKKTSAAPNAHLRHRHRNGAFGVPELVEALVEVELALQDRVVEQHQVP